MPIIPRANPSDVTAVDLAPNVRNTTEVRPAQGMADAIGGVTAQVVKIHQEAEDRNDATAVMAARRQLSDWEANTFDPNNPEGISKYQGGNALAAGQDLIPDLDKHVSQISAGMTRNQQAAFGNVAQSFRESVQGRLNTHMTQQHEVFLQAEDKATQDGLLNDGVAAAMQGDYATGTQRMAEGKSAIELSLVHRGMPADVIASAQHAYESSYHGAIIDNLLQSDPDKAQAYYGDHETAMTVDDRLKVERVLRPVATESLARAANDADLAGTAIPAAAHPIEGAAQTLAQAEDIARQSVARTFGLESGGQADAKNPNSSATGAGQFLDGTWLDVITRNRPDLTAGKSKAEVLALRKDPAIAKAMTEAYAVENCKGLFESGLPVTPETAYLCHHFGLAGARNILRANPNTPIANVIDPQSYAANGYLKGKTVAEVLGNHEARAHEAPRVAPALTPDGKPDFTALEARVMATSNPLLRDARIRDLEQRRTLQDRAERDHAESMTTSINDAVEAAPVGQTYDKVLNPEQQAFARDHGLVDNVQTRLKARVAGSLTQSDPLLVDTLHREASQDPATFATRKVYILQHADKLSTSDLSDLIGKVDALNDPKKRGQQADWATETQRINSGLRTIGINPGAKDNGTKEKAAQFGMAYRQAKEAYVQTFKEEPKGDKADALLRNVVRNFAEDERNKRGHAGVQAYENMAAGNPMKDNAGKPVQLSEADRTQVRTLLRQRLGRDPTEAEILSKVGAYYAGGGR